jgi:lysine 6-dehydrogenase
MATNKKYDFVVLGATGMQGKIVTKDLLKSGYSVLLCGRDKSRVEHLLKNKNTAFKYFDARNVKYMTELLEESGVDVAVNCVEGDWNMHIMKACMKAGVNVLDLGSDIPMTMHQLKHHDTFKDEELISITGCGSVPGVGNIMLKYAAPKFDSIHTIEVGFSWDSNIKKFVVPFSIQSIIEEFTDPATIIQNCKFIKKRPLDKIIEDKWRAIGKEKCFYVRHPETYTFWHYFKTKGVKNIHFYAGFPQHSFDRILSMIELKLGSKKEIDFRGVKVKPINFLTEVLKTIEIPKGYTETENLWVDIKGRKNGAKKRILMECIVPTLKGWEDAGCNIDTGMPASIMAQMVKTGIINEKGSFAPEAVVPPEMFFKELRKRHMIVYENGRVIN